MSEYKLPENRPYEPGWVNRLNWWFESLPGHPVYYYIGLLVITGLANHLVAYQHGFLQPGEFVPLLGFSSIWVVESLYFHHYIGRVANRALDEFRPLLSVDDVQFETLRYEFIVMPARPVLIYSLMGAVFGLYMAYYTQPFQPAVNYAFPPLLYTTWALAIAFFGEFAYRAVRQLGLVRRFYRELQNVNLFDLQPLRAFSSLSGWTAMALVIISYVNLLVVPELLQASIFVFYIGLIALIALLTFFLPLTGINKQLSDEKKRLLNENSHRIADLLAQFNAATDEKDLERAGKLRLVLSGLKDERDLINPIPTWPWKPGTLRAILSATFLPVILSIIQSLIRGWLGF